MYGEKLFNYLLFWKLFGWNFWNRMIWFSIGAVISKFWSIDSLRMSFICLFILNIFSSLICNRMDGGRLSCSTMGSLMVPDQVIMYPSQEGNFPRPVCHRNSLLVFMRWISIVPQKPICQHLCCVYAVLNWYIRKWDALSGNFYLFLLNSGLYLKSIEFLWSCSWFLEVKFQIIVKRPNFHSFMYFLEISGLLQNHLLRDCNKKN